MQSIQGPLLHGQDATPADCRHSKAAFHALFVPIAKRTDLSDAAKLLYEGLISMVRQGYRWTQAEIAEQLGWRKRQKVWRAAAELIAAGLLRVKRLGLQRPNEYTLVETEGVTQEDIKAKAPRSHVPKAGHQEVRPRNVPTRARQPEPKKKPDERIPVPLSAGRCFGCGGDHATPNCERYGYAFRT